MEQEHQEGAQVQVTVHRQHGCRVEMEIEASQKLVRNAHAQAVLWMAKQVALPGFRKGKAPLDLVAKHYPKEIESRREKEIATNSYIESQKLLHIPSARIDGELSIQYRIQSQSLEEGAKLTVSFEAAPVIPSVDPKQLELTAPKTVQLTDEHVDETIRQLLFFLAEWHPITDRPVQNGDFVLLDVVALDAEGGAEHPLFTGTRFEVTERRMAQWMRDLVLHQPVGAVLEGTSRPDPDLPEEQKQAFESKQCRVTIRAIEQVTLPPMDDAFAQTMGAPSLAELRQQIDALLREKLALEQTTLLRQQIHDQLLAKYPFDLPASLVSGETHGRLKLLSEEKDFPAYWDSLDEKARAELVRQLINQSERALRLFYLCRQVLTDAHLSFDPKEMAQAPSTTLQTLMQLQQQGPGLTTPELTHSRSFSVFVTHKAADFLLEQISHSGAN